MTLHADSPLVLLLRNNALGDAMRDVPWLFPGFEVLHFAGMAMLVGAVGVLDLRMLGVARGLPVAGLHRFLPLGVAGFVINLLTGIGFVTFDPLAYLMVTAYRLKMLLMLLAGVNVLLFYLVLPPQVRRLPAGAVAPLPARLVALASLLLWIGVIWTGRFIAFTGKGTL